MPEIETKEPAETTAEEAPQKSALPGRLMPLLSKIGLFGGIGLVAIFAALILTTKVLKPMLAHSPQSTQQKAEEIRKEEPPAPAEESKPEATTAEEGEGGEKGGHNGKFFDFKDIVVNPAGTGGTRYLSCSISFEVENESDMKVFQSREVQIKDLLLTVLSSKTVDELSDVVLRNKMRQQILAVVNKFAAPARAKAVYLTDFVLQ